MIYLRPKNISNSLWRNRDLIIELTKRELRQRYYGSLLGFLWAIMAPLISLAIYTFVFSYIFKARWTSGPQQSSSVGFALNLFAGLTAFNIFSEVITRSVTLITAVPNYVKKVVFPLEIYPIVILSASVIMSFANIVLLVLANLFLSGSFSITIIFLPLVYLPLILLCLGLSWFLASLGVYIRDLTQFMPIFTTIMFFISPIVYPIDAIPASIRPFLLFNPLTMISESFRQVLINNNMLPWISWLIWTVITCILALLGYVWFMGTKKGFADVL